MRVTILDTGDPRTISGGQSSFVRTLVRELECDIRIAGTTSAKNPPRGWGHIRIGDRDIPFLALASDVNPHARPLVPLRLRCLLSAIAKRRILSEETDILYIQSPELALPFTARSAAPYALHLHGSVNPAIRSRYALFRAAPLVRAYDWLMTRVVRASAATIVVERDGLAYCQSVSSGDGRLCRLIEPCYDEAVFRPADKLEQRRVLGIPEDDQVLLFVGRLEAGKGLALLLGAVEELLPGLPRLRLMIAGEGSQGDSLRRNISAGPLADRVSILGWQQPAALASYLAAADAFVLPSDAEGLPISVIEALACGIPVIATRVGGIPDLITDGENGILVSPGERGELVEGIRSVLSRSWTESTLTESVSKFTGAATSRRVLSVLRDAFDGVRA